MLDVVLPQLNSLKTPARGNGYAKKPIVWIAREHMFGIRTFSIDLDSMLLSHNFTYESPSFSVRLRLGRTCVRLNCKKSAYE